MKLAEEKPEPVVVKVGAVSVTVHRQGDGRFAIYYQLARGGKRRKITRGTFPEAKQAAEKLCGDIAKGRHATATVNDEDILVLLSARELLEGTGFEVDAAAREVAEALRISGGQAAPAEMARFWARHHQAAKSRTTGEVLAELVRAKTKQGLDAEYLRNLRQPLEKFAKKFPGPIGEISAKEIREYIDGLPVEPRTKVNVRANIILLFRFARTAKDLPGDRTTEAESVGKVKVRRKLPVVYTAHQLSAWLGLVRDEWLPWMALGAFAGIRTAEIGRMDWSDILWITKEIHVRPEVAKTGEGRYIPLHDNLAAWLHKHRKGTGPIFPDKGRPNLETARMNKLARKAAETSGRTPVLGDNNALRHSYGSHRLGMIQDLGKLTVEMGNSIAVNRRNYQNPRSRQQYVEYFALMPPTPGKIIPLSHG